MIFSFLIGYTHLYVIYTAGILLWKDIIRNFTLVITLKLIYSFFYRSRQGTISNSTCSRPSQPQVPLLHQHQHQQQQQTIIAPHRPTNLPGGITLTTGVPANLRNIHTRNRPNLTITPSVTITPASVPPQKNRNVRGLELFSFFVILSLFTFIIMDIFLFKMQQSSAVSIIASGNNSVNDTDRLSSRGDMQTAAEKQAAAKMALRKQLEKTLLQV